jgi:hypothetical protein
VDTDGNLNGNGLELDSNNDNAEGGEEVSFPTRDILLQYIY